MNQNDLVRILSGMKDDLRKEFGRELDALDARLKALEERKTLTLKGKAA